jgi:RHS repeat-associated protein
MKISPLVQRIAIAALAFIATTVTAASTITYYHNDLAGSPVAATNASGQVIWRESYRPYGERLTNSAASTDNKIYFTSRRQDAETGLVYMGARYYDPVIGRFISTDPKQFDEQNPQLFNRYAYANNNPYKYRDPDGRGPELLALCVNPVSCAAVGVLAIATTYYGVEALKGTAHALNIYSQSNESGKSGVTLDSAGNSASLPPDDDKGPKKGDLRAVKERKLEHDGIDAHRLKDDFVGDRGGQYNISVESSSGDVYLTSVRRGAAEPIKTGLRYEQLAETYPLSQ